MVRYLLPLVIFLGLAAFLYKGLDSNPRYVPSQQVGKPAPDFDLPQLLNPEKTLSTKALKGQVWVLNIWGSWCPTCRIEHPVLTRLANSGVAPLYGLNWKDENRDDAIQWLQTYKNPYKAIGYDPSGRVGMDYGAYAAPETFIVDKQGVVRFHHRGEVTRELLEYEMLPLIRELNG